jgi:hypothetical protein
MGPGNRNGQTNRPFALAVKAPGRGAITCGAFARATAELSSTRGPSTPGKPTGLATGPGPSEHSTNTTQTVAARLKLMSGGLASENSGHTTYASYLFTSPDGMLPPGAHSKHVEGPRTLAGGSGAYAAPAPAGELVSILEAGGMRAGSAGSTGSNLLKTNFGQSGWTLGHGPTAGRTPQDADGSQEKTGTSSAGDSTQPARASVRPEPNGRITRGEASNTTA